MIGSKTDPGKLHFKRKYIPDADAIRLGNGQSDRMKKRKGLFFSNNHIPDSGLRMVKQYKP